MTMMKRYISSLLLITTLFGTSIASASEWQNNFIAYSWVFGQRGTMNMGNTTSTLCITPQDVLENLNLIDFILQLHYETSKKPYSFMVDTTMVSITVQASLPRTTITSKTSFALVDAGLFYHVWSHPFAYPCRSISVELLAGIRDLYTQADINITPLITLTNGGNWLGALAGARVIFQVYAPFQVIVRADASAGSQSHSYSATGLVRYTFHNCVEIGAGYRIVDFCGNLGSNTDRFGLDIIYYGPMAGIGIQW